MESIRDKKVYNLYQEFLISEEQEEELYKLVDPEDKVPIPAELGLTSTAACQYGTLFSKGGSK